MTDLMCYEEDMSQNMYLMEDSLVDSTDMPLPEAAFACLEVPAAHDRRMATDNRVLVNLLKDEDLSRHEVVDYCNQDSGDLDEMSGPCQPEIRPHMRKIVLDWLLEVCQDEQCQPQVFHLTANYLDRYLTRRQLPKRHLQAVGAACLLLATKFAEVRPLSTEKLSLYTDHSVSAIELREWEMTVLNVLGWDLSIVTSQTFLEHFLIRQAASPKVKRHAEILAAVALTEYKFLLVRPSVMAAACLAAASHGLEADGCRLPEAFMATDRCQQAEVVVHHLEELLTVFKDMSRVMVPEKQTVSYASQSHGVPTAKASREEGTTTPTDCHQVSAMIEA